MSLNDGSPTMTMPVAPTGMMNGGGWGGFFGGRQVSATFKIRNPRIAACKTHSFTENNVAPEEFLNRVFYGIIYDFYCFLPRHSKPLITDF